MSYNWGGERSGGKITQLGWGEERSNVIQQGWGEERSNATRQRWGEERTNATRQGWGEERSNVIQLGWGEERSNVMQMIWVKLLFIRTRFHSGFSVQNSFRHYRCLEITMLGLCRLPRV